MTLACGPSCDRVCVPKPSTISPMQAPWFITSAVIHSEMSSSEGPLGGCLVSPEIWSGVWASAIHLFQEEPLDFWITHLLHPTMAGSGVQLNTWIELYLMKYYMTSHVWIDILSLWVGLCIFIFPEQCLDITLTHTFEIFLAKSQLGAMVLWLCLMKWVFLFMRAYCWD